MRSKLNARAALAVLSFLSCASCAETSSIKSANGNPDNADPGKSPEISAFSKQLAYCEAVYRFIATDLVRQHDSDNARTALMLSTGVATSNAFLNAENGEVSEATQAQFEKASEGQLYIWTYSPQLAYSAFDSCEPYVTDGWNRAKARGGQVDGKTMKAWREDRFQTERRKIGLP